MKKRWMMGMVVAGGIVAWAGIGQAAEYGAETPAAVSRVLQEYYQAEQGNRVTVYSIQGLMLTVQKVFEGNVVPLEKPGVRGQGSGVGEKTGVRGQGSGVGEKPGVRGQGSGVGEKTGVRGQGSGVGKGEEGGKTK